MTHKDFHCLNKYWVEGERGAGETLGWVGPPVVEMETAPTETDPTELARWRLCCRPSSAVLHTCLPHCP